MDKFLTKTGLDRVFDSLRKNQSYEDYRLLQSIKSNGRDFTLGNIAEWGLHEFNEWLSREGYLDPLFESLLWLFGDGGAINPNVADDYQRAYAFRPACEPLVLDLDGDGIESLPANGQILFDHDADGTKHATGWINSDDGLLALDKNGDGKITSGRELFGDQTLLADGTRANHGFDALAQHDSNHDGQINAQDQIYTDLRVWRDLNADGQSTADELFSLDQLGIQAISLDPAQSNQTLPGGARADVI